MKKDQSDEELSFKKRARRRLVGAIALVLLMVILLPMILEDRSVAEQQEEIAITMENEALYDELDTAGFDSSIVPENGEDNTLAEMEEGASIALELPKQTDPEQAIPTKKAVATSDKPQQQVKVNATSTTKAAATANDAHYVQVGVYSNIDSVKKLQVKLKELGYASKTESVITDKGEKIRLRTAAFSNRNEAIIALQNIKDSGLTGMVVKQK